MLLELVGGAEKSDPVADAVGIEVATAWRATRFAGGGEAGMAAR